MIFGKRLGQWLALKTPYVKQGGVWKIPKSIWVKKNNTWVLQYEGAKPIPVTLVLAEFWKDARGIGVLGVYNDTNGNTFGYTTPSDFFIGFDQLTHFYYSSDLDETVIAFRWPYTEVMWKTVKVENTIVPVDSFVLNYGAFGGTRTSYTLQGVNLFAGKKPGDSVFVEFR